MRTADRRHLLRLVVAGALTFAGATTRQAVAQSTEALALQARFAGRHLVLLSDGNRVVLQDGRDALELPTANGRRYETLSIVDSEWLASGTIDEDEGTQIFLLQGASGEWRHHGVPGGRLESRWGARPLVEAGQLRGLIWIEGAAPATAGVRFSAWDGSLWTPPDWVSPPGSGSTLAASLAPLPDRRRLAIWTSFDGEDDEVLFSEWSDGAWAAPARVADDNRVPDITPALAPTSNGAVAAWSSYDGNDYRVRIATFVDGVWSSPMWLGEAGSVFPDFVFDGADDEADFELLFRTVSTETWSLVELDSSGSIRRRIAQSSSPRRRPIVRRSAAGDLRLEWPRIESLQRQVP